MKLAAIDIGSNACRLLIDEVIQNPQGKIDFVKVSLVRVPLRLGFDVFEIGEISSQKESNLIKTILSYKLLLEVYEVKHLKACATSAMRDARNSAQILQRVKEETYLYIDVGGGSTELTFFSDGKLAAKESFNIGTIRLLKNQVSENEWDAMKDFIKNNKVDYHHITAIGSGGNINKIFTLSKRKEGKSLNLELLRNYYKEFSSLSLAERMSLYKFREDRADVIVPALLIYINVMRWAETEEIFVPKIGLADGLIHLLYDEVMTTQVVH